jgi:hypothetical protein
MSAFLGRLPARSLLVLAGATLALAGLADAWKQGGQQPFSLPPGARPPTAVWNGPATKRAAVSVRTNAGAVRVQAPVGTPIGTVPANATAVWEGSWESLTVSGASDVTSTGHTTLNEESALELERRVGGGTLTLPLPGGGTAFTCYRGNAARCRLLLFKPSGAGVTASSGASTLAVEAGDTACFLHTTDQFVLSGGGTTEFEIFDLAAEGRPTWSLAGTASAQTPDDVDGFQFDGTARVRITLWNRSASGQVVVSATPACVPTASVGPGASTSSFGAVSEFRWAYQGGASQVTFTIENE